MQGVNVLIDDLNCECYKTRKKNSNRSVSPVELETSFIPNGYLTLIVNLYRTGHRFDFLTFEELGLRDLEEEMSIKH